MGEYAHPTKTLQFTRSANYDRKIAFQLCMRNAGVFNLAGGGEMVFLPYGRGKPQKNRWPAIAITTSVAINGLLVLLRIRAFILLKTTSITPIHFLAPYLIIVDFAPFWEFFIALFFLGSGAIWMCWDALAELGEEEDACFAKMMALLSLAFTSLLFASVIYPLIRVVFHRF